MTALLTLLLLGQFAASHTGELHVLVTDPGGLPVPAVVELTSDAVQMQERVDTDTAGRVTFRRLPFATYRLTVSAPGFAPSTTNVPIESAAAAERTIALSIAALETSISVRADDGLVDPHEAAAIRRIGAGRLDERSATAPGRALIEVINAEPGWLLEANGVLHPRGSEYDTQYVIDGLPITDNRSPGFAPALGDSNIRSVGVLTGGFPAEYGRKLGGVVEVVTQAAGERGLHAGGSVTAASAATIDGEGTAGYSREAGSFTVSGGFTTTDRYLDPPVEEDFTNHGTSGRAAVRAERDLAASSRAGVILRYGSSRFLVPNERVQQAVGQQQERSNREWVVQGSLRTVLGARGVVEVVGMGRRVSAGLQSNLSATPVIVAQERSLDEGYLKASVAAHYGVHEIKAGADVNLSRVREALAYTITDASQFADGAEPAFAFRASTRGNEQALFMQDQIRSGPWTLNAGLRWDRYHLLTQENAWSPRLSAARALPGRGFAVRASYDGIFQTPAIENLLLSGAVPGSRGHFVEAGVSKVLFARGRVDASGFVRRLENFADDDTLLNTGISFPIAFRTATVRGLEVKLDTGGRGPWSGSLGYALARGEGRGPVTGGLMLDGAALDRATFPISQDQRHTLRGRVRLAVSRGWVAASTTYGSGLPFEFSGSRDQALEQYGERIVARVNFETGRVRSSASVDMAAGVRLGSGSRRAVRLQLDVRNVANRFDVINFAGLFSGTALGVPRSFGVRLTADF